MADRLSMNVEGFDHWLNGEAELNFRNAVYQIMMEIGRLLKESYVQNIQSKVYGRSSVYQTGTLLRSVTTPTLVMSGDVITTAVTIDPSATYQRSWGGGQSVAKVAVYLEKGWAGRRYQGKPYMVFHWPTAPAGKPSQGGVYRFKSIWHEGQQGLGFIADTRRQMEQIAQHKFNEAGLGSLVRVTID